jgi:hypothetical protein
MTVTERRLVGLLGATLVAGVGVVAGSGVLAIFLYRRDEVSEGVDGFFC